MTEVNRMIHKLCSKPFYEIDGEEIKNCPFCKKELETADCELSAKRKLIVNPLSGNTSYGKDLLK